MSIPLSQRALAIVFSLLLLLAIIQLIRRRRLREEYALIWFAASAGIVVLSVFGGLVEVLASLFSVSYPPTLVIVLGLLFALVVILSQSVVISTQADRLRDLAQTVSLLELRLRQLEGSSPAGPALGTAEEQAA